ncbi:MULTISPECIES: RedB [Rhodopirellula]|uniref:RedB n=1 Tax=Rhodopirellula TaxID=265488 RepID=UPI00257E9FA6|nr:RedB [Rhodopirellula sp. UBA1907]
MGWKIALSMLLLPGLIGMTQLVSYSSQPGKVGQSVPELLPCSLSGEEPFRGADQTTVLIFYHPHCPCTRATIRCMERMIASFASQPNIVAYAFIPSGEVDSWIESETTDKLRSFGNVSIVADHDAKASRQFDVATSGHVLVYNDARLSFSGGITPSRGHEGSCDSGAAFLNSINGESNQRVKWPVFGCAIVSPSEGA